MELPPRTWPLTRTTAMHRTRMLRGAAGHYGDFHWAGPILSPHDDGTSVTSRCGIAYSWSTLTVRFPTVASWCAAGHERRSILLHMGKVGPATVAASLTSGTRWSPNATMFS